MIWSLFPPQHQTTDNKHGRLEIRAIWASDALNSSLDFPHTGQALDSRRCQGQVFCINRDVTHTKSKKHTNETVYGITSLSPQNASPERLLSLNRGHWSIENSLHYVRDVTFYEDLSTIRTKNAPRVMASLKNLIIGIFRWLSCSTIKKTIRAMTYTPRFVLKLLRH